MTIILRLQGLDVKAGAADVRTFFEGLHIPDGGVYILGGRLREAFIAFATERDGQLAMRLTGNALKGSKVTLHISSMAELELKLESALKQKKKPSLSQPTVKRPPSPPEPPDANVPPLNSCPEPLPQPLSHVITNLQPLNPNSIDSNSAFILGICTVLQSLQSSVHRENAEVPKTDSTVYLDAVKTPTQTLDSRPGYVRLFGLPATTTKEAICLFFKGLTVQEAIVNVELGRSHVCLVKFANMQDACDALHFNQKILGSICVEVRGATEKMWTSALQQCESAFQARERVKPKPSPFKGTENHKQNDTAALQHKRKSVNQRLSKSPKKTRLEVNSITRLLPTMEYIVMVSNIPKNMTKTEIKELFECPDLAHKNVQHLRDKNSVRTETAFLVFNRIEDYNYAMNLSGCHVGSEAIKVTSITKKMMWDMMSETHQRSPKHCPKTNPVKKLKQKRKSNPVETPEKTSVNPAAQTCLYVRNMPANVQESHIRKLFCRYEVRMGDITLLHDSNGEGIGEAVVQFRTQKLAALAHRLHYVDFLGTKLLLTRITVEQMEDILANHI